jgi:hypothetical protein
MKTLNDRERHILIERRLKDEPTTLEDLSQQYDVSRERVRQIEVRAFEKLQRAMQLAGRRTAPRRPRRLIASVPSPVTGEGAPPSKQVQRHLHGSRLPSGPAGGRRPACMFTCTDGMISRGIDQRRVPARCAWRRTRPPSPRRAHGCWLHARPPPSSPRRSRRPLGP